MFILLITYEFPPHMNTGGIGSYMYHLAHLLSGAGHNVTVFSATTRQDIVQKEEHTYCTNYLFPAANLADFREQVRRFFHTYILHHQVDVIESPEVGACALGIKEDFPHIPLMVRLHTPGVLITKVSNTYQPLYEKLRYVLGALRRGRLDAGYWSRTDKNRYRDPEYQICMLADKLVSPSQALKNFLRRYWRIEKEIDVIPNPFHADADLFEYPIEGREKIICFVGKLTILKGMFTFTKAIKHILQKYPDYRVIIAGRDEKISDAVPSMKAWMEARLTQVRDRVVFTGALSRAEVKQLLGKSRICVVPSLWENYPTVVLEAMAAGAAVAAANRGGIPEIVKRGITGYLFNPLHAGKIVNALHRLIENDKRRQEVAHNARKRVRQLQSESEPAILGLFESITSHRKYK